MACAILPVPTKAILEKAGVVVVVVVVVVASEKWPALIRRREKDDCGGSLESVSIL